MIKSTSQTLGETAKSTTALRGEVNAITGEINNRAGQGAAITDLQKQVTDIQAIDIAAERAAAIDPVTARVDALETIITPEGEDTRCLATTRDSSA